MTMTKEEVEVESNLSKVGVDAPKAVEEVKTWIPLANLASSTKFLHYFLNLVYKWSSERSSLHHAPQVIPIPVHLLSQ